MAASDEIRKLREESAKASAVIKDMLKGLDAQAAKAQRLDPIYKKQLEILTEAEKRIKEIRAQQKQTIGDLQRQEQNLKSIDGYAKSIVSMDRDRIRLQDKLGITDSAAVESINTIIEKRDELLKLSYEDEISRNNISEEMLKEIAALRAKGDEYEVIADNLERQYRTSNNLAKLTENEQKVLNKQLAAYQSIEETLGAIFGTAGLLFKSSTGLMAGLAFGLGKLATSIGQANKELGTSFSLSGGVATNVGLTSLLFDDAAANAKELAAQLGGSDRFSLQTGVNMSLIARTMGISGTEAASLVGSFSRLNGNSTEVAQDMIATSREFAKQNNIIPAQLMGQLAGATEEFALYGEKGGENILRAAGYAAKLGVEMGTLSGIADNLLDFESSITKELELGAMLGRNINLDRARALAYEGKIGEATLETLNAVGGIEAFNQMDVFAKKQTAATLGVSVAQLQKMASLQAEGVNLSEVTSENFDTMSAGLETGLNEGLGKFLNLIGSSIIGLGQMGTQIFTHRRLMSALNKETQSFMVISKSGKMFDAASPQGRMILTKGGTQSLAQGMQQQGITGKTPQIMGKGSVGSQMSAAGSRATSLLKGAAAMVLVAGSLFILGKALQEFKGIGKDELLAAGAGLLGLTVSLAALGAIMSSGVGAVAILAGAAAMVVIAGSIYVLGKALQEMASGFTMLSSLQEQLLPLMSMTTGIIGLAGSLAVLGASLFTLGTLGSVSIPVLLALGAAGVGIGAVMGKEVETQTESIDISREQLSKNITDKLEEVRLEVRKSGQIVLDGSLLSRATTRRQDNDVFNIGGTINQ